jgi:hypothetical protein
MGRGVFNGMLKNLGSAADVLTDNRREGFDLKYKPAGALTSALSVFFFPHPSMLDFQVKMKRKRSNPETVMRAKEIPSNVQITTLLDGISPDSAGDAFNKDLQAADRWGA